MLVSTRRLPLPIALLLALTTLLFYLPVVHDGFVNFDDQEYVTENHHVLAGRNLGMGCGIRLVQQRVRRLDREFSRSLHGVPGVDR